MKVREIEREMNSPWEQNLDLHENCINFIEKLCFVRVCREKRAPSMAKSLKIMHVQINGKMIKINETVVYASHKMWIPDFPVR